MKVRPGVNAVRLAFGLFVLAFFTHWSPLMLWFIAAAVVVAIGLAVVDYGAVQRRMAQVQLVRRVPSVVGRGDPFEIRWTITTTAAQPLSGELRDELPNLCRPRLVLERFVTAVRPAMASDDSGLAAQWNQAELRRVLTIPERGRYTIGPLWVRLPGPLRLLDGQQVLQQLDAVRVLPETYASPERFRKELGAEIHLLDKPVFARQQGDGADFESLREFRQGDDPRRIDWRATARMQRPIVRKFQIERHRDVLIAVDCGRLMGSQVEVIPASNDRSLSLPSSAEQPSPTDRDDSRRRHRGTKLDCAVDAALLLARTALQGGDRCGFALFDRSVRGYLPPVAGLPSLPELVDCVYDAAVDWGESDFAPLYSTLQRRQSKRSLLVILSDLLDAATSEQFRGSLQRLAQRHVVLFAALRTPLLNALVRRPVDTLEQAAEQAVAYRVLHDRDSALQTLRRGGIRILDVEPHQLTVPLINEFVAIRRRNVL